MLWGSVCSSGTRRGRVDSAVLEPSSAAHSYSYSPPWRLTRPAASAWLERQRRVTRRSAQKLAAGSACEAYRLAQPSAANGWVGVRLYIDEEIWGDTGRYAEIWGDMGRHPPCLLYTSDAADDTP